MVEIHSDREEITILEEEALLEVVVHKIDLSSKQVKVDLEVVSDHLISIEVDSHSSKAHLWQIIHLINNIKHQEDMVVDLNKEQLSILIESTTVKEAIYKIEASLEVACENVTLIITVTLNRAINFDN